MQVRREGLYFKQKHYKCVRADEYSIYLKNVRWQELWQSWNLWKHPFSFTAWWHEYLNTSWKPSHASFLLSLNITFPAVELNGLATLFIFHQLFFINKLLFVFQQEKKVSPRFFWHNHFTRAFPLPHAFKASKALSCIVVSSLFSAVGKWRCKTWVGYLEGVSLVTLVAVFQWSTYTLSLNSCI